MKIITGALMRMTLLLFLLRSFLWRPYLQYVSQQEVYSKKETSNNSDLFYCFIGFSYDGWDNSFVSGWGVKQYRGELKPGPPFKVQHVPVGEEECDVMNDPDQSIFPGMMCAGGEEDQDACQVKLVPALSVYIV